MLIYFIFYRIHSAYHELLVFDVLESAFDIMQIYPKLLEKPHMTVMIHRTLVVAR